jgi:hypothetical protein
MALKNLWRASVKLSGWKRIGISVSVIWILVWLALYLVDPYKTYREVAFGLIFFGLCPVVSIWFLWWIWEGFRKGSDPS